MKTIAYLILFGVVIYLFCVAWYGMDHLDQPTEWDIRKILF